MRGAVTPQGGIAMRSLARLAAAAVALAAAALALAGPNELLAVPCVDYGGFSVPVGYTQTADEVTDVAIAGQYAYVAEPDSGLQVVDISNPNAPRPGARVRIPGFVFGVTVFGSHAYLVSWDSGLHV